eukprot:SAG22_NODE_11057_length_503_cov_0.606436_1_plen_108_part_10
MTGHLRRLLKSISGNRVHSQQPYLYCAARPDSTLPAWAAVDVDNACSAAAALHNPQPKAAPMARRRGLLLLFTAATVLVPGGATIGTAAAAADSSSRGGGGGVPSHTV